MRPLPLLLLLAACGPSDIKLGDSGGDGPVEGDEDGDGYAAIDNGGDDCDDTDPFAHPGAAEVWYDGYDQDCDGGSDYDQDGDGEDQAPTGLDCDDLDAAMNSTAPESRDLADQDCDGLVDEDFIVAGAVVVSEVMHHPLATSDADGEWFELTNTDTESIDLVGWRITADDGDSITLGSSLVVGPGERVVFGANANTGLNGGVTVDYAYNRDNLSLSTDDTLFLKVGTTTVFDVEWSSGWSMSDGRSVSLDPDHMAVLDARQSSYWCVASSTFGSGDYGTPGAANDDCTALDEDGDGYSIDEGDCDDTSADISPGAADIWDGLDNNCDGEADGGDAGDVAVGRVDGSATGYLGVHGGLGLGDVTGDGMADLLVGGAFQGGYQGSISVIDGLDHEGLTGTVSSAALATVSGLNNNTFGATSPLAGDVTGDGVVDLVVASGGYGTGGNSAIVGVYQGGAGLSGAMDRDDADLAVTGSLTAGGGAYGNNRVLTSLDMNGDGFADVVYGRPNETSSSLVKGEVAIIDGAALVDAAVAIDDADTILTGDSSQDYLGSGLGGTDVDGDGYDDLYVGAIGFDDYAEDGGTWYQIDGGSTWGGAAEVDNAEARTISGALADARVGFGAPAFGDFDEDGFLDVAFGGMESDAVWLFYGIAASASNLDTSDADLVIEGDNNFGFTVSAGDLDGDDNLDLIVGAPAITTTGTYASAPSYWYYAAGTDDGALYIFDARRLGSGSADTSDAWATAEGETRGDLFGSVMSAPADIDGDGADDILVAAPRGGTNNAGRAYVIKGR